MPIQGTIEEAGLPDVLQLLALGRKTGCLAVSDGALRGEIYLDLGRISCATVANRQDRLGDMLVKNGRITQEHLREALEFQRRSSGRQLGRILVDSGRIDRAELERFVRIQVEEAVYFLFTWRQGTFTFTSDQRPSRQALLVSLDAESLLLEGARRVDEWSLIQKKIPSYDLVYRRSRYKLSEHATGELTEEQKQLLPLLDGTRDVTALVDLTGMSEFDVGKALYGLIMAGFAQLVERRAQVRHLEYRELLAYVVREAEFADAQRRKEAGRHIVDCPTCAERLRTIHVRRTEGSGVLTAAGVLQSAAVEAAPARVSPPPGPVAAAPPPPPARPEPGFLERRVHERRTGRDRRRSERRTGLDRRVTQVAWAQAGVERRVAPRREDDRRSYAPARDRRGDHERWPAATHTTPMVPTAEPRGRITGPRHLQTIEVPEERPLDVAPAAEAPPAPQAEAPAPPTPPAPRETEGPAAAPPGRTLSPSRDLEWIVSPEQSVEMIRASRSEPRAAGASDLDIARIPVAPAPPRPERGRHAGAAPPAGPAPVGQPRGAQLPLQPHDVWPVEVVRRLAQATRGRKFPVRSVATAAGIAAFGLLSYLVGHRGGGPAPGRAAGEAAPSSAVTSAEAQPPARGRPGVSAPAATRAVPEQVARGAAPMPPRALPPAARVEIAAPPRRAEQPQAAPAPAAAAPQPVTALPAPAVQAPPTPTVGIVRGVVRGSGGRALAGARVSVRGTNLSAVTDASGAFTIEGVPDGQAVVQAVADGYVAASADVRAQAGATVSADLTLNAVPAATEPDRELAAGGWLVVDRSEATTLLGGTLGAIEGLPIESISQSATGARARVRVVQLAPSGARIVLTETRAGAAVRGAGPTVVTALRVMPPSEAYPYSTGTASLGNILITAKSSLAADALRALLERLGEVR